MSNTKLRPEDLTSDERALWDETYRHRLGRGHGPKVSSQEASEVILARRALFGQGESETPAPEKVKCPNCGEAVDHSLVHVVEWSAHGAKRYDCPKYAQPEPAAPEKVKCPNCGQEIAYKDEHLHKDDMPHIPAFYTCQRQQPAPPEPAAREMPEAVKEAIDFLRELGNEGNPNKQCTENICRQRADTLESWWRNLAQPVECKECLELIDERDRREEQIGRAAAALGMEDEWTSACDVGDALIERCEEISAAANSVLIQQAAQGRKVRDGITLLLHKAQHDPRVGLNHREGFERGTKGEFQ